MSSNVRMTTETTGFIETWVNTPVVVALVFALAGAFFISIYFLRRSKK